MGKQRAGGIAPGRGHLDGLEDVTGQSMSKNRMEAGQAGMLGGWLGGHGPRYEPCIKSKCNRKSLGSFKESDLNHHCGIFFFNHSIT